MLKAQVSATLSSRQLPVYLSRYLTELILLGTDCMIYEVIPHLKMGTVGYHSSKVILERTRLVWSA
jgi:hypothetical protein